jgi:hypothetical protein
MLSASWDTAQKADPRNPKALASHQALMMRVIKESTCRTFLLIQETRSAIA